MKNGCCLGPMVAVCAVLAVCCAGEVAMVRQGWYIPMGIQVLALIGVGAVVVLIVIIILILISYETESNNQSDQ